MLNINFRFFYFGIDRWSPNSSFGFHRSSFRASILQIDPDVAESISSLEVDPFSSDHRAWDDHRSKKKVFLLRTPSCLITGSIPLVLPRAGQAHLERQHPPIGSLSHWRKLRKGVYLKTICHSIRSTEMSINPKVIQAIVLFFFLFLNLPTILSSSPSLIMIAMSGTAAIPFITAA